MLLKWKLQLEINRDKKLSDGARRVGMELLNCLNLQTKQCNPSYNYLARKSGLCVRSVKYGMKQLIVHRYVVIMLKRHQGKSNWYGFNFNLVQDDASRGANSRQKVVHDIAPKTIKETIKETPKEFKNEKVKSLIGFASKMMSVDRSGRTSYSDTVRGKKSKKGTLEYAVEYMGRNWSKHYSREYWSDLQVYLLSEDPEKVKWALKECNERIYGRSFA